jgi:hypothetical protein
MLCQLLAGGTDNDVVLVDLPPKGIVTNAHLTVI